jgi:hypothetical protein
MSSLDELGFSISLIKAVDLGMSNGIGMLELLDAPSKTNGWSSTFNSATWNRPKYSKVIRVKGSSLGPVNQPLGLTSRD